MIPGRCPVLDMKATGSNIRRLRKEKHLRAQDISSFMGLESEQAIYKWQRGDCLPSIENLLALSVMMEITVNDILVYYREEDESPLLHFYLVTG